MNATMQGCTNRTSADAVSSNRRCSDCQARKLCQAVMQARQEDRPVRKRLLAVPCSNRPLRTEPPLVMLGQGTYQTSFMASDF